MGDDMLTIGMVVGLDYRDAALSVHDLLQELKTHPKIRPMLEGGERLEWGAKTIPSGGFHSLPTPLHAPGLLLCGDGAGMVNIPTLKGVHYAIESGRLAAEAAFALSSAEDNPDPLGRCAYDEAVRSSFIGQGPRTRCATCARLRARILRGGCARGASMIVSKGGSRSGKLRASRTTAQPLLRTDRPHRYPVPDGKLTFDKLSSVFASGNKTRDDQPNHIRVQQRVPPRSAELWAHMCPAQVY